MTSQQIIQQVRQYYDGKLADHGPTPRGVDWNSAESQRLRFRELARVCEGDPGADLNDYGCGYGAFAAYVREIGHAGAYCGFDISAAMIEAARQHCAGLADCTFVTARAGVEPAAYTVASGIFNVKQNATDEEWRRHVLDTIADLASISTRGFAFNALTSYSDPDRRRPDLYYADPRDLFDHCARHVSRFVSLLHDTPLYEFTMLVRL
jgi:SAM-dependent methyltransferase